jgi:Protein of unknown function (DUF2934)
MATPNRARTTSSTTRKKAAVPQAQETTVQFAKTNNVVEAIRFRAYQLFEQRGRRDGFDIEDWLRAEGEIASRGTAQSA